MRLIPLILTLLAFCKPVLADEPYRCKTIDREWSWFEEIYFASGDYTFVGQSGRSFDIFAGWSVFGKLVGQSKTFSGVVDYHVDALAAVLKVRQADPGLPFKVCMGSKGIDPHTILSTEF